jgi:AraC family transcriptional regulator of adaptative response/methylated-DNA-[protein]-cysteine methyltransferase
MAIRWAIRSSLLGTTLVAVDAQGVVALLPGDDEGSVLSDLTDRVAPGELEPATAAEASLIDRALRALDGGEAPPLAPRGTPFQLRVWDALRQTRVGERLTYRVLAERIGKPLAARAVASACAANPVAVLIPCHRVVRTDGGLGGFRWGLDRKRQLLARESVTP